MQAFYLVYADFRPQRSNFAMNLKINGMRKLLLFKEIYAEAFRDWTFRMLTKYFKAYSWFCFALLILVIYAFIYRVSTGFVFA
ncbi:hypothetical protein D9O36_04750 [Zobellia amurskyensis]|uniref:Uncharacterized protein n=2 Tax=Zobellia amurskyensis TaxID=248905 RepID=A0A7X2ZRM7_9FLAO|nr:hypothetical protein [Zobellia amurskyensis]